MWCLNGFWVRPGIYNIPGHGRVDATQPLPEQELVDLYLNKHFPFIRINEKAIKALKAQNLTLKQLAGLIHRASSKEEVQYLLKVRSTKALERIASVRSFEPDSS